jgi:predicted negative regulator of RcsB-dependent stress response
VSNLSNKEQADLVKAFWNDYGRWVAIAILVGLLFGTGWRWYGTHRQKQQVAASALYSDLLQSSLGGGHEKALNAVIMKDFKDNYPSSAYRSFAEMLAARQDMDKSALDQAGVRLRSVVASGANSALVDLSRVRLARVLLAQSKPTEALQALDGVNKKSSDIMTMLVGIERAKAYIALKQPEKAQQLVASIQAQAKSKGFEIPGWVLK